MRATVRYQHRDEADRETARHRASLASFYGGIVAREVRLGNPNNAENMAVVAGHHALYSKRADHRRAKGQVKGDCACDLQ